MARVAGYASKETEMAVYTGFDYLVRATMEGRVDRKTREDRRHQAALEDEARRERQAKRSK